MSTEATFEDLDAIADIVVQQEEAIRERDGDLWDVFVKYRDAYVESTGGLDIEQTNTQQLVKRYLMSSSFIAARYAQMHDKQNRDTLAQSCATLLSSLDLQPMQMLEQHIQCEKLWMKCFRENGIGTSEQGAGSTLTVGNTIKLIVLGWAVFGLYSSFANGSIPLVSWRTSHNIVFGFMWLFFVLPGTLHQLRALHNAFSAVAIWNHGWSILPFVVANLIAQITGIVMIPVAWLPSPLPGPLETFHGGAVTGIATLVVAIAVMAPCNFAIGGYMKWLFREQHEEYLRAVEQKS